MSALLRSQLQASLADTEPREVALSAVEGQIAALADYGRKYRSPDYVEAMEDARKIVERIREGAKIGASS